MTVSLKSHKHSNKPTNFHPLPVLSLKWLWTHICSACGDIVAGGSLHFSLFNGNSSDVYMLTKTMPWKHLIAKNKLLLLTSHKISYTVRWWLCLLYHGAKCSMCCQRSSTFSVYSQCKLTDLEFPVGFFCSIFSSFIFFQLSMSALEQIP